MSSKGAIPWKILTFIITIVVIVVLLMIAYNFVKPWF